MTSGDRNEENTISILHTLQNEMSSSEFRITGSFLILLIQKISQEIYYTHSNDYFFKYLAINQQLTNYAIFLLKQI